ncbi:MAG: efflux RND transporter permease subunit [Bacteroidales bacterium]|jgi:HAE1 family hydrophobic/amphiphilic exporter-1|nr:efflux RND transporter permease subunit [Bacteroidales bacterium]
MKIYESSVKKPITTAIIFVALVVLGLFSYSKLSIDMMPEIELNRAVVIVTYPGASAEDVENNVTKILESALSTVSDLKKITSTSKENTSIIQIEFNWGTDIDAGVNDMRDKIEMVKSYMPDGCSNPIIMKISTDMMPIAIYSATANESSEGLYKILDDGIANPLARINGVGSVSVAGAPQREISVNVDPQKLEAYNLTIEQIGAAIAQENINTPAGSFDIGSETYSLRIEGEMKESRLLNDIVVSNYGDKVVFLKDVATVRDSVQERAQESYVNGRKGATIVIQKQTGANSVDIMNKIKERLPQITKNLPKDIQVTEMMNTTDNIENSISSLVETVLLAFLFVVIVVLFFLGKWRATIIILMTIPISLIASFIYLFVSGNTINIISLSSLSIAIGMVVDDAIVVLENITKHIERGAKPKEAAIYGTNEVGVAVMASTLTIFAVFFPLTMVGGMAGIIFAQLGWMVCIVMAISLLCALTLTPMLSSLLLKQMPKGEGERYSKFYTPIKKALDKLDGAYSRLINWCVKHKRITISTGTFIFIASLFLFFGIGSEMIPASDNGQISGNFELPVGANVERSRVVAKRFETFINKNYPEVKNFSYTLGIPADDDDNTWAQMQTSGTNYVSFRVRTKDLKDRKKSIFEIAEGLRKELASYTEIYKYQVTAGGQNGMMGGSTVDVEILGYDFATTENLAKQVRQKMNELKGFRNIYISREDYKPQYQVEFDREKLALNGLNVATAASFIRNRMNGLTASLFREDGEEYKIKVRYDKAHRQNIEDIENVTIVNGMGKSIKLKEVAKVVEKFSPPSIERQDRERIIKVSATLYDETLDKATKSIQDELDKMDIPSNIGVQIGGTIEDQQDSFNDLSVLALLIVLLVYIVMAAQFESLRYPFIIMFSIPFALIGVLVALFITGGTINMISAIGAIMLIGIVVKNGIVLVDYINLNRERGMGLTAAVISGSKSRLRPVLMTTATTVLGMIPMAIGLGEGSEIWQPMGVTIVGGLTVSTLVTLVMIPILYCVFASTEVNKRHRKGKIKLNRRTNKD